MKIAVAQLNFHIGNFEGNYEKIEKAVLEAKAANADLILFPELAITGYPPRDFLEFNDFIECCMDTVHRIARLTSEGKIAVIIGGPAKNPDKEGKDLYNTAFFLAEGKLQQEAHKALLPTYDVFDEYRYFEPATTFQVVPFKGKRIALTVCEDIWNISNKNPLYPVCPMDQLMGQRPDFMVNISASPFEYKRAHDRIRVLKANTQRYGLPVFYVNHVGAQTELIFDGGSLVVNDNGTVVEEMPYFQEALHYFELDRLYQAQKPREKDRLQTKEKIPLIHDALVLGIRDYFGKLGFKKAVLGLSGGIDSALTLTLAAEALGPENCLGLMMPSQFSSEHSITDSKTLVKNLGCLHDMVGIEPIFKVYIQQLDQAFKDYPFDTTEENLQARARAVLLMAYSNKFDYILLNTSNKSEAAVGYTTLYGDMSGGLSVIGDVYKTQVYELCRYINRNGEVIPENIINKPPSAELRPNQRDTDSLPPYEVLDEILYQYIELRKGPREIIDSGFPENEVRRILRLVNVSEYKRHQTPPVLRVSPKAFGMGRRMPIVAKYLS